MHVAINDLMHPDSRKGNYGTIVMLIKWHLAIALIFCFADVYAQHDLLTDTTAGTYSAALSKTYTSQNELFIEGLKNETTDKKLLKHYLSSYNAIFKRLNKEITDGQMFYVPELFAALEKTYSDIRAKNPSVPGDLQILLLRDDQPNAITVGDKCIFVNLGLFYYLENEGQLAAVLSHEIAHLMMTHTLKALQYNYEKNKEHVTDVKEVKHTETQRADRAFDLLKNSIYQSGKISREHEMQADSAGYRLYKNMGYQKSAYTEVLDIVERNENVRPDGLATETYRRLFDLPNQKFDEKWLKEEDFSAYNYSSFTQKFDKDSASSHPKSKERIQYLKAIFPELAQPENITGTHISGTFDELRTLAQKKQIPNLFFKEQYGEFIYMLLVQLQKNPNNQVYKDWLGEGFQKMYEARKTYQMNKYLDRIAPKYQSESYIQFLSFMWNLKLDEIKNIASYYTKKV